MATDAAMALGIRLQALSENIETALGTAILAIKKDIDAALKSRDLEAAFVIFHYAKEANSAIDTARKVLGSTLEVYNKGKLPEALEKANLDQIRCPRLGRSFYTRQEASASILDKAKLREWLVANEAEDLIQETVNASSLKAFITSYLEEKGEEPPEDAVKYSTYETIRSSKYTPK